MNNFSAEQEWLLARALGFDAGPRPTGVSEEEAAKFEAAAGVLQAWSIAPPTGLENRIIAAAGKRPALRVVRSEESARRVVERRNAGEVVLAFGGLRDVISVAAVFVLMVGLGVPGLINMRQRNQRIGCNQNLASLAQGLQSYATTYGSALPFLGWGSDRSWRPTPQPNVRLQHNRQHLEPLALEQYVSDARRFICPSGCDVPMTREQVRRGVAFADARNVSYAYFNMAGAKPRLGDNPELPIFADDNPLFDNGTPRLDIRKLWKDAEEMNSPAHRGAGQNVLSLGGHVRWTRTPHAGIDKDNIWTLNAVSDYTGREGPTTDTDAHLLK